MLTPLDTKLATLLRYIFAISIKLSVHRSEIYDKYIPTVTTITCDQKVSFLVSRLIHR